MIRSVKISGFRCLQDIALPLDPLQILVGANASGKSTFLDLFGFVSSVVRNGAIAAFEERTPTPIDLVFGRKPGRIDIQFEVAPPSTIFREVDVPPCRLEYSLGLDVSSDTTPPLVSEETVRLLIDEELGDFTPPRLAQSNGLVIAREPGFEDHFVSERTNDVYRFSLGPDKSLLGNLPADRSRFPIASWLKEFLAKGVLPISLDGHKLRQVSAPSAAGSIKTDGSSLPWMIHHLRKDNPPVFQDWLRHVSITLPGLHNVESVVREEDRHAYLIVTYENGLRIPSWSISDGTLKLLALTVLAYLPNEGRLYLVEEPENGIHPTAVEAIYQSLSSVYDGQVFVASHSPVLLSAAAPTQLLCFSKDAVTGSVSVIRGDRHPRLQDWKNEVPLGVMVASGILD